MDDWLFPMTIDELIESPMLVWTVVSYISLSIASTRSRMTTILPVYYLDIWKRGAELLGLDPQHRQESIATEAGPGA